MKWHSYKPVPDVATSRNSLPWFTRTEHLLLWLSRLLTIVGAGRDAWGYAPVPRGPSRHICGVRKPMPANKNASRRTLKSDLARVDAHIVSAKEYRELRSSRRTCLHAPRSRKAAVHVHVHSPQEAHLASASCGCHCALEGNGSGLANAHGRAP